VPEGADFCPGALFAPLCAPLETLVPAARLESTARHVSASLGGRYLPPGSGIGFSAPDGQAGACSAVPVKEPRNPNPLSASMTKWKQQLRFLSQPDFRVSILRCEHEPGREYRVKVAARDACGLQLTETHSRFGLKCIPHMSSVQQRRTEIDCLFRETLGKVLFERSKRRVYS
jgi:hypothetical protein